MFARISSWQILMTGNKCDAVRCLNQAVIYEEKKSKNSSIDKIYIQCWYNNYVNFIHYMAAIAESETENVCFYCLIHECEHDGTDCSLIAKISYDVRIYLRCLRLFDVCRSVCMCLLYCRFTFHTVYNKRLIGVKCCVKRHCKYAAFV